MLSLNKGKQEEWDSLLLGEAIQTLIRSARKFSLGVEINPSERLFAWRLSNNGVMECVLLAAFQEDGGSGTPLRHLVARIFTAPLEFADWAHPGTMSWRSEAGCEFWELRCPFISTFLSLKMISGLYCVNETTETSADPPRKWIASAKLEERTMKLS
jgi:hypothetical protein